VSELSDLTLDYRAAFQRYLPQRSEAALTVGYQLGRQAIVRGVSLLDVVHVHHRVLAEVLGSSPREDLMEVTSAAADFLSEVLSTFDMAHRSLLAEPTKPGRRSGKAPG
jgi:hypothetical protein